MEIYNFVYTAENNKQILESKSSLILGKFSVFHKGHKELLENAKKLPTKNKIGITLLINDDSIEILDLQSKLNNLAEIGFDFVVLINFDFNIKSMHAKDFIDNMITRYNVENFIVGKDFRFGLDRMWSSMDLKEYFEKTTICEIQKINKIKISSSSIAEMVATGEVKLINKLLMSKYSSIIKYHNSKFTWNDKLIKPHNGIYFIKMQIDDYWYHGLLNISMTNNHKIFLLNYDGNFIDDSYLIQIIEEYRMIINSRFDFITEQDEKKCFEFFYSLQKNNI